MRKSHFELFLSNPGPDQTIQFRTNIDVFVNLNKNHRLRIEIDSKTHEPSPYIFLDKGLEAKLSRSVFYELVDLGVEFKLGDKLLYGVWSHKEFFQIAPLEDLWCQTSI